MVTSQGGRHSQDDRIPQAAEHGIFTKWPNLADVPPASAAKFEAICRAFDAEADLYSNYRFLCGYTHAGIDLANIWIVLDGALEAGGGPVHRTRVSPVGSHPNPGSGSRQRLRCSCTGLASGHVRGRMLPRMSAAEGDPSRCPARS